MVISSYTYIFVAVLSVHRLFTLYNISCIHSVHARPIFSGAVASIQVIVEQAKPFTPV